MQSEPSLSSPTREQLVVWRTFLEAAFALIDILDAELQEERGISLRWYDVLVHLEEAEHGTDLVCGFFQRPGELTVRVSGTVDGAIEPDDDSFAWQVLTTLATSASAEATDSTFTITLSMTSSLGAHQEPGL